MNATATRTHATLSTTRFIGRSHGHWNGEIHVIGPVLVELVITQTTRWDASDRPFNYDPSYSIVINGKHQTGGPARHLPSWSEIPPFIQFLDVVPDWQPPASGSTWRWTSRDGNTTIEGTYRGNADYVGTPDLTIDLEDVRVTKRSEDGWTDQVTYRCATGEVEFASCVPVTMEAPLMVVRPEPGMRSALQAMLERLDHVRGGGLTSEELSGFAYAMGTAMHYANPWSARDVANAINNDAAIVAVEDR